MTIVRFHLREATPQRDLRFLELIQRVFTASGWVKARSTDKLGCPL